jgi:peptide/nickel transport system ATP-binding protein
MGETMTSAIQHPHPAATKTATLLELRGLAVDYGSTRVVNGVDLAIGAGEIVGLAGESGCGKSTVANAMMQILPPTARVTGGSILFRGEDLVTRSREELRTFRWQNVSIVFQSAMNALNPVTRVGDQFVDMMQAHERISKKQALAQAGDLLELMCMDRQRVRAYPHELSGGMRQRVIIAMALALEPELIILDEPTTALDVVVQREILQRVQELQRQRQFAVLFITHDLSLLIETAHRIAIMYAGSIVETAESSRLGANPLHPYTRGLLASFPPLRGPRQRLTGIGGAPPDLRDPPAGCRFHPRCPECRPDRLGLYERQTTEVPLLRELEPGHQVACHLVEGATS